MSNLIDPRNMLQTTASAGAGTPRSHGSQTSDLLTTFNHDIVPQCQRALQGGRRPFTINSCLRRGSNPLTIRMCLGSRNSESSRICPQIPRSQRPLKPRIPSGPVSWLPTRGAYIRFHNFCKHQPRWRALWRAAAERPRPKRTATPKQMHLRMTTTLSLPQRCTRLRVPQAGTLV